MALPPFIQNQSRGVVHSNDPVTIIDYPSYVSVMEWGGAQSTAFGVSPILSYPPLGTGISQPYGSSTTDDSLAINAALVALSGTGLRLYFPAGTYLVSANAIVNAGNVPIELAPGAYITGTYASTLLTQGVVNYARAVMTTVATSTTYTGTGTSTLTFGSNAAIGTQDGVTGLVAGDCVLLQGGTLGSCAITAADTGPWIISNAGGTSAKVVLVRPSWWQTGQIVPTLAAIKIGNEGTLFGGTQWTAWCTQGSTVIGTTDPQFYPDLVSTQITLAASTKAVTTIPIRSATATTLTFSFVNANSGTTTSTVGYSIIAAPTPGYIGTCTFTVDALASGMTKNGTSDTSIISALICNRAA